MNLKSFIDLLLSGAMGVDDEQILLVDLWGKEIYSGPIGKCPLMYLRKAHIKNIVLPDSENVLTITVWGLQDAGLQYSTNVSGRYVRADECLEIGKELYDAYGPDVDPYDLDEEDAECYLAYKRSLEFSSFVSGRYVRASKYDLVGQDGNAFALMGYTARALKNEGLRELVPEMQQRATSGDYWDLIAVCDEYIQMANDAAIENGYIDDDENIW